MTNENKTAIQQAEKQLEQERADKLKQEVYQYLKGELEAIDSIDQKIRLLSEEKRAHEENIKNIKQGNLKAIEKRRNDFAWNVYTPQPTWTVYTHPTNGLYPINGSSDFYYTVVSGTTVTTSTGKTYIF